MTRYQHDSRTCPYCPPRRRWRTLLLAAAFLAVAYLFGAALGDRLERVPGRGAVSNQALEEVGR